MAKPGIGDEHLFASFRQASPISTYLGVVNNQYNVGFTFFEKRYDAATKPVCVLGFKPDIDGDLAVFTGKNEYNVNLVDKRLMGIYKKYGLV